MWFDGGLTGFCRVLKVLYSGLMGLCTGLHMGFGVGSGLC